MLPQLATRLGDLAANGLSLLLAGSCAGFAAYMVVRLQGMENPPHDMGLNFPKKTVSKEVLVDPMTTGSIGPAPESDPPIRHIVQPYMAGGPVLERRLLLVINGVAFVELTRVNGKEVKPFSKGAELPDAGPITRLEWANGRWELEAGDVLLTAPRR